MSEPYDPFRRATPGPTPREELFVWSCVKDVRTQVFPSRAHAERDLMRTKDALEATGWHLKADIEKGGADE
jgi:hypothetical protein